MANIMIRRGNGGALPAAPAEWDPLRMMREPFSWDPFREMAPAWPVEDRMAAFVPAFEVKETQESYVFKADLPGIQEADLEVTLTGNRLTVAGKREAERKEEKGDKFFAYERSYGSFTRSFTMPEGSDFEHIRSELKDGVLTLVVPKKPELQPRRIEVKGGEKVKS